MIFLDSDVAIDILRGVDGAERWLRDQPDEIVGVSGFVAMELIQGCRDLSEQNAVSGFLNRFNMLWPDRTTCEAAFNLFTSHRLSNGLGMLDALIAAHAIAINKSLYTFNRKHYSCISELSTQEPYSR